MRSKPNYFEVVLFVVFVVVVVNVVFAVFDDVLLLFLSLIFILLF